MIQPTGYEPKDTPVFDELSKGEMSPHTRELVINFSLTSKQSSNQEYCKVTTTLVNFQERKQMSEKEIETLEQQLLNLRLDFNNQADQISEKLQSIRKRQSQQRIAKEASGKLKTKD